MKKSSYLFIRSLQIIFLIVSLNSLMNKTVAQSPQSPLAPGGFNYVLRDPPTYSAGSLYESTTGTNATFIGLGTTNPNANFHIIGPAIPAPQPILQIDAGTGILTTGTIRFGYLDGVDHRNCAIYQDGASLFNIFKSPVLTSQLSTNSFILRDNNQALGKYLASDAEGQGSWTDFPVIPGNYWLPVGNGTDIFLDKSLTKVGIGTNSPMQKLHIVNGSVLISRQDGQKKDFGSLNGSILFGEIASENEPNGQWGIEYYNPDLGGDFSKGGLNFYKVANPLHQGSNYNLFLRNDGKNGIGTENPMQKFHVLDGNILISKSSSKAGEVPLGNILFGDVVNSDYPNGEWGIEYLKQGTDYNAGGLNFWKPVSGSSGGSTNNLFLKNDGNVGIGTLSPGDKLQVGEGISKVVLGEGPINITPSKVGSKIGEENKIISKDPASATNGAGYLGFNVTHNQGGWFVSGGSSGSSGTLIYNDRIGHMHFASIPYSGPDGQQFTQPEMIDKTKLTITEYGLGIGTLYPQVPLDIQEGGIVPAEIKCYNTTGLHAGIWLGNTLASYGLVTDFHGVGHIMENYENQQSIMSFQSGNVEFPGNVGVLGKVEVSGRVGIGANLDLANYTGNSLLFVKGGITTEEVTVKVNANWSDFVFSRDYKLRPIYELDQYINANKHLPDIPTTEDVKKDGIEVGRMNALLLQKIEELSLYVIEQQKQIDVLRKKIEERNN